MVPHGVNLEPATLNPKPGGLFHDITSGRLEHALSLGHLAQQILRDFGAGLKFTLEIRAIV